MEKEVFSESIVFSFSFQNVFAHAAAAYAHSAETERTQEESSTLFFKVPNLHFELLLRRHTRHDYRKDIVFNHGNSLRTGK